MTYQTRPVTETQGFFYPVNGECTLFIAVGGDVTSIPIQLGRRTSTADVRVFFQVLRRKQVSKLLFD